MNRTFRNLLIFACAFFVLLSPLHAQKTTGSIKGVVTDPQGAVVAGADVLAHEIATNAERKVTTNSQGGYSVPDVSAGMYEVRVSSKGFKETVAKNVDVHVASIVTVNLQMQMGASSEVITVEANAIQVQTESAAVGEVVDGSQVRELPLNGRSFVQLTQLQPGVSADNSFDSKNKGLQSGVDFAVNGNPTTNNLFLVDGANNNDIGSNRTILVYPSIDAIAEFKMLTNSYGPEYGQASGSVITIITRGGTNKFHGGASYFGRNDKLNATEFFAARNAQAAKLAGNPLANNGKDKLRRNDYGYNIGGPIVKDKLFFFWSQEWNKEIRGETRKACVPTAAEASGDFTVTGCGEPQPKIPVALQAAGNPFKIANPDPAGLLIAQLLPAPNTTASLANGGKNWVSSIPTAINWREENVRIDYKFLKKHLATFRYTQDSWTNPAPNAQNYWGDDPFPAVEGNWDQPGKSLTAKVTSTLTDTLVNDAQFSYSGNKINITTGGTNIGLPDKINAVFPGVFPEAGKRPGGLLTIWGGLGNYGDGNNLWLMSPFNNHQDLYTIRDDISKSYGSHTFKTGAYLSFNAKNENDYGGGERPSFGTPDWAVKQGTGNELSNILLPGQVFNGVAERSTTPTAQTRWHDYEFYFGDTWKMRSNLTVEYGFRWSFLREPFAANKAISSWDYTKFNPAGAVGDVCNGLVVVPGTDPCTASGVAGLSKGTPGVNAALRKNNNHNIAPRLGITWDPFGQGKTAIRAGIGQFFQRERVAPYLGMAFNAPFTINSTGDRSFASPPVAAPKVSPSAGIDPRATEPNSWQWNLTIEHELARQTTFQIGYVGNRGLHLTSTYNQNPVLPQNQVTAAFKSGGSLDALRFAPVFGQIGRFSRDGWSTYHSLQTVFRTRVKEWFNLSAAYTWSHSIANYDLNDSGGNTNSGNFSDTFNPSLDKGNSTINRPHIFVANAIFYGPQMKGHNPFVEGTLGGWEFATISTLESGNSFTVFTNGVSDANVGLGPKDANGDPIYSLSTLSGTGNNQNQRPNVTGLACDAKTAGAGSEQIFNPAAFSVTGFTIGTIGNEPRGYCRGPGNVNADMALYKNWKVAERLGIQFRLEFFNAFNTANFSGDLGAGKFNNSFNIGAVSCGVSYCNPANNVITAFGSPGASFGQSNKTHGAREIQYALKFTF